jgi:hypothetical protein
MILGCFVMSITGCAYEANYRAYADAQAKMALYGGPLLELYPDGKLKSLGNPSTALAMALMKPPSSEADSMFHFLNSIAPFAAMWGIVGTMANMKSGSTTNVSGANNLVGNTSSGGSILSSPPTTTTTTTSGMETMPRELTVLMEAR